MSEEKRVVKTTEKVVSSKKVVPQKKNILKDNPISQRIKKVSGAIKAIPFGILLLLVGLWLTYASVVNVKEISKIVDRIDSISADKADSNHDLAFFTGKPELNTGNSFEYKVCEKSYECTEDYEFSTKKIEDVIYISAKFERFEQKEEKRTETRTRIENGEEIEDTVEITELVEDWETKREVENWYSFKLGKFTVESPERADRFINTNENTVERVYIPNLSTPYISKEDASDKVGSTRLVITTYSPTGNINVVAEIVNNRVDNSSTFIITEQDQNTLVETLQRREKTSRGSMRFFAWLALTIGFMTVLGPIMSIIEIIPFAGKIANFIALVAGAIISAIVVFVGVIIVKFWWVFVILILLLICGGVYLFMLSQKSKETPETTN